ncbi:TonB-dependent siderophore receptor [Sphingomonas sp. AR_OL41]|uniref:TonB-dependent siderophore receptor n=1 Tax=Sphingomonas sp. AR_OL41 TaxID=3042729 RepID=UPI00248187D3|nr:TonB-dependent siderophore receptor [Sphingomonas sp. AR_OL41]MDH7974470.1 TonB-dependent siderophore receptor [Sphingomonas sp. AR_OL41]
MIMQQRTPALVRLAATASALALAMSAAGGAWAQAAPAQPPAPAADDTETTTADIVVKGRFVDTGATSATKLDIRVLDTPFSVDSYNGNFLKAIETTNVSDLYKYMTGIQRAGNTGYDITFRGFKTSGNDRNAILTDGLPGLSVRFGSPPTIGTERIELVKGATSVLYGQAQPGGFINIITKKPKATAAYQVELKGFTGAGTYGRAIGYLPSIDFTGPITSDGSVLYRVVAEAGYSRGFRTDSYEKPIYIAPSLTWKIDSRTDITLQGEYRRDKSHYDTYLVAPNRDVSLIAPINTTYQEPNDYLLERGYIGTVLAHHDFSDKAKFNISYRYVDHFDTQLNFDVNGFKAATPANPTAPLTTLTRRARGQINKRTYSFVDANFDFKFDTFGIRHTLLIGGGGGQETASLDRTQFYNCTTACTSLDVNINNPVIGSAPPLTSFPLDTSSSLANLTWRFTTQNSIGVYASDLIEFGDMFKAMVGVRYADEHQTIQDLRTPNGVQYKHDRKTLPLAGLIFEPTRQISFYASYATSFVPTAAASQDVFGLNPFVPTYAQSYEGGAKMELFNHRLNITMAYFDIEKQNTLNTTTCLTLVQLNAAIAAGTITVPSNAPRAANGDLIPGTGTCSDQIGKERSRGFEIELNASPLPGWTITGGYAHTKARVVSANAKLPYQAGARETNSPDDALNFWTRYDFQGGALDNLGVGFGVSYIGKRVGFLPPSASDPRPENGTMPLPAYATVDLGLYYKLKNIDLTFKVTNLFDKRYIESAGFTGDINLVPGTPRLLTATARIHF